MFLCSRAENSQHGSGVTTEQRSFAAWRLAIAFARLSSAVVSSECDDLHFDSAGNDSATVNSYPTRRDYRKLLALPRNVRRVRAFRWRHCRRLVRSLSVAAPTAPGQKLFGGGTDGAGSEASRWRWRHCHAWSEACRWRHRRRRVKSFSVAALTAPGQKLLGGGGGTATPG